MRFNWGTGIAAVYGLFATATLGFVVFAMQHPVQLVSEDYYGSSLRHDQHREAQENADALGPGILTLAADARTVVIALPAAQVRDATGTARLYRPSNAAADRSVRLVLDAGGRQRVPLEELAPGRWIVQLEWSSGGRSFYREAPVMLR